LTAVLENKYVEPELRYVEISRFDIRKETEQYHKDQLDTEEEESDKFTSLVESIRELGILQPVYVIQKSGNAYEVIDGGRRLRAAKFLHLKTVPAMVFQGDHDESEIRKRALIANINRKDLSQEEKGEGLVEYYRSGGVDPGRAISYLNTLRQRRQVGNTRTSGISTGNGGQKLFGHYKKENPKEYERFLELHKRLGIPRMTQYQWLTVVIYIDPQIRASETFQRLPRPDQKLLLNTEVRNKPSVQKQIVKELASINNEIERVKKTEKKEAVKQKIEEIKEKRDEKLRQYFPNTTDKKSKKSKSPFETYGEINGLISKLWKGLTFGKKDPISTDDIVNDFIKPTREQFKAYLAGISKEQRIQQYNWLAWLEKVVDDRLKLLDEATGK
jgi:hypothetical protein